MVLLTKLLEVFREDGLPRHGSVAERGEITQRMEGGSGKEKE